MIVPMKRITLFCMESDRDSALTTLQDLGVLHLIPAQPPAGPQMDEVRRQRAEADQCAIILRACARADQAKPDASPAAREPAAIVRTTLELSRRKHELTEELQSLTLEHNALLPLGDFDPALVLRLAEKGLHVRLFMTQAAEIPALAQGVTKLWTRRDGKSLYCALAGAASFDCDMTAIPLPGRRLSEVKAEIQRARESLNSVESELQTLSLSIQRVEEFGVGISDRLAFLEAQAGMNAQSKIAWIQGFCPGEQAATLRQAASGNGWGLLIEDPLPGEAVPTLIRNPGWLKPIEPLFKMIKILPGYQEVDVSALFLIFLTIFFAMIVGDAGYGLLFLIGIRWARARNRKAPSAPFTLMTLFSSATLVWGVLSGTYFGITNLWAPLEMARIDWLLNEKNMMTLCLVIGAVHLTLAHGWNVLRMLNSLQALAQLGWICIVWTIFFAARTLINDTPFPGAAMFVGAMGLLAILLFMTPVKKMKTDFINHVMLPLSLFSAFGDVLSYLRLFALSVAGVQVADAFNTIAKTLGFNSPGRFIGAVLLLLGAHAFNMLLSVMSVLVHGIRLNALEFSMHLGLEWSGRPYDPFSRKTPPAQGDRPGISPSA